MTKVLRIVARLAPSAPWPASLRAQLRRRNGPRCWRFFASKLLLGVLDPGGKRLLAHDVYCDWHESVILAAKFRALTIIDAFPRRSEPSLVDPPGNGIDLDPERRHAEGMNDIRAGGDHANRLVHRHHHFVVHREEPRLTLLALALFEHQGIKFEVAVVRITVAPIPLFAGRLNGEIGGRHVELKEQELE